MSDGADSGGAPAVTQWVMVGAQPFAWTPGAGLDPAASGAIRHWICKLANGLRYRAMAEGVSVDDLIQEGLLGAVEKAKTFDPALGASYMTYATFGIREKMLAAIRPSDVYIPSRHLPELRSNGAFPSVRSLDAPLSSDGASFGSLIPDNQGGDGSSSAHFSLLRNEIHRALCMIPAYEASVLRRFYGIGQPAEPPGELTRTLGCSHDSLNRTLCRGRFSLRRILAQAMPEQAWH